MNHITTLKWRWWVQIETTYVKRYVYLWQNRIIFSFFELFAVTKELETHILIQFPVPLLNDALQVAYGKLLIHNQASY